MKFCNLILAGVFAIIISGCAHPIRIDPTISNLPSEAQGAKKITANVGYFIPTDSRILEVTTPGGGGDNVRYFPYRDIESGYRTLLESVFTDAKRLLSLPSQSTEGAQNVDFVFIPTIVTSSVGSFFTWPPTNFTVDISSQVRDKTGKQIEVIRAVGIGSAGVGERLGDHGFAGRRAAEDALIKMRSLIFESKIFNSIDSTSKNSTNAVKNNISTTERLNELKLLLEKGAITKDEHDVKRKSIIDSL
jgi:hypothetical protein